MEGSTPPQALDETRPKRRRLPGVNLRPGSVKQARLEAGLSLAQLGRGHVTAPAIYLIETGRTRPSLPTLEHIARRTGKPVEYFLAEPSTGADETAASLLALNSMVLEGRIQEAIDLGCSLLEPGNSGFRLGHVRFQLAQAYLNSSEPELAEPLLAEAKAHFEAAGDVAMTASCIGGQAALATIKRSPEAAALARQALELCQTVTPRRFGLELRLYGLLASALMQMREWDAAIEANSKAMEIGEPLLDARHLATAFSELGHAYLALGQRENASRFLIRALGLFDLVRNRALLATAEHNIGTMLMARRDFTEARVHLDRALELSDHSDAVFSRARVLLTLSELSLEEGDVRGAAERAAEALQGAEDGGDAATAADAHVRLGLIAERAGDAASADREFERAIRGFQAAGPQDRLQNVHGIYAEVLERRGDLATAYVHMKQALQVSRPAGAANGQGEKRASSA